MSKFINAVSNDPTHIAMETVSDVSNTLNIIFESYNEDMTDLDSSDETDQDS